MNRYSFVVFFWLVSLALAQAQGSFISANEVRYMVTHEPATGVFTAWVVPNYTTPNANNPESEDWGATAQFSLKVPRDFVLTSLYDIRGSWDKASYKLTTPPAFTQTGADARWAYYIIGKAPQETNYGPFNAGDPVALFTFKGTGGDPAQVAVLQPEDGFAEFAEKQMSLNIRSSFYSRSGQRAIGSAMPLEQMNGVVSLKKVLKDKQTQMGLLAVNIEENLAELSVMVYPNPALDVVNVTYFSPIEQSNFQLELLDAKSTIRQTNALNAKAGLNTVQLNVANLPGGIYFVRTQLQDRQITKKLIKQ